MIRRPSRAAIILLVACAAGAIPRAASAAEWNAEIAVAVASSGDRSTLAPTTRTAYALSRRWRLRAEWGFVEALQESTGKHGWTRFEAGNLLFGLDARRAAGGLRGSLGAALALPTARLDGEHDSHGRIAFGDASTLHGLWDLWLWAPHRLGVVAPVDAGLEGRWYRLGLESAAALLMPVRATLGTSADALAQARLVAALRRDRSEAGVQLQAVLIATQPSDRCQTAVAPFVRLQFGPVGLAARLLLPIDAPLGGHRSLHLTLSLRGPDATHRENHPGDADGDPDWMPVGGRL